MTADSNINMMDFVLIIMQAAKLHKLKLNTYQNRLFMFYLTFPRNGRQEKRAAVSRPAKGGFSEAEKRSFGG